MAKFDICNRDKCEHANVVGHVIVPMMVSYSFLGAGEIVVVSVGSLGDSGRFLHFALEVGLHFCTSTSSTLHLRQKRDYHQLQLVLKSVLQF